jgi:myo-inositol-1(or 4)-monophosphatase
MTTIVTPELATVISIVRATAQSELVTRFKRIKQQLKDDGSILTEADLAMQSQLQQKFMNQWPTIPFLAEEMPSEEQQRLLANADGGIWVVDPLDGTSNFSVGIPYYAVSVAYILNGQIELGVVYDPERDEMFSARRNNGAYLNETRLDLQSMANVQRMTIGIVDFKRLSSELATKLVTNAPYKSQRSFGSVALDWCWIAAGRGDVYVHGKQNLWDYAAGHLVLHEAGGFASTLTGEPVFNSELVPRSAVLAINSALYQRWFTFLQT